MTSRGVRRSYGAIGANGGDTSVLEENCDTVSGEDSTLLMVNQPKEGFGIRHLISFLGFLGFANVYAMRVNLSVAIVVMVNNTAIPHVNTTSTDVCPSNSNGTSDGNTDGPFDWDEREQGLILGSFFWGYIITNVIGGRLAEMVGGRMVMGVGVLGTAVLTIVTPLFAYWNVYAFIAIRVLEGMFEGVTFPAMSSLLSRWIPPNERSSIVAIVYAGALFGTVVSFPLSGVLCASDFLGGWPSVFYLFGLSGLVWSLLWFWLAADCPAEQRYISSREVLYISNALQRNDGVLYKVHPVPWAKIFASPPMWGILFSHFGQNWGFYTLLTEMPTYLKNILHFNIKQNAFLTSLPYLAMWLISLLSGYTADLFIRSKLLSTTTTRKLYNSLAEFGASICIIAAGYSGCNSLLIISLLTMGTGITGAQYAGVGASHLDISQNFAGTIMGLTNAVANTSGFLAPLLVGTLVNGNETIERWRILFLIAGGVMTLGNIMYLLLFEAKIQQWDKVHTDDDDTPPPAPEILSHDLAIASHT